MIAIWGANGFIGRHLAQALDGQSMKLFSRGFDGFPLPAHERVQTYEADFADPGADIGKLEGCAGLVLLVAAVDFREGKNNLDDLQLYRNFFASLRPMRAPPRHIVFLSSGGAVYGVTENKPIREDHALEPISAYGKSKQQIESLIADEASGAPWRYTILRVANPIGPWCKRKLMADRAIEAVRTGTPLTVLGDGSAVRDYFDVRELAQLVAQIAGKSGENEIYNVGSGKGTTVLELLDTVSEVCGKPVPFVHGPANELDVPYNVLDCAKIKNAAGWQARKSLKDIIREMHQSA